jgi:hypothetical protein
MTATQTNAAKTTVKYAVLRTSLSGEPFLRRVGEYYDIRSAAVAKADLLSADSSDDYRISREEYMGDTHVSTRTVG